MKIKWTGPQRRVKGLGILNDGDVREVDTTTGKNLVKQGLAVLYKFKKIKREVK